VTATNFFFRITFDKALVAQMTLIERSTIAVIAQMTLHQIEGIKLSDHVSATSLPKCDRASIYIAILAQRAEIDHEMFHGKAQWTAESVHFAAGNGGPFLVK
jgi:hypothetical protein